jgi:D-3-phosphoglycerate dehydrogenase
MVEPYEVIIAGTEPITAKVMDRAPNLKLISRVGIGLDSVDLLAAEERGISVSYTPDAPAPAVAELTLGLMLSLLRHVQVSNLQMHNGGWERQFGRRVALCKVGIIGMGRIGTGVLRHLAGFGCAEVLVNDLEEKDINTHGLPMRWCDKETIYREADIITLHDPLTAQTHNMIDRNQLAIMQDDAILINTARGGIVNESDLYAVLQSGRLAGAALDVFEQEPYAGSLGKIERCILTSHMGSMSVDCRSKMEIEATEEAIRFLSGRPLEGEVPDEEYQVQRGL